MIYRRILAGALICLLLSGCGSAPADPSLPQETLPTASQTAPETTAPPSTEPTIPFETTAPTTEPEPILEAGANVYADGDALKSGSVIFEGVTYVKVSEFLDALDGTDPVLDDAGAYAISWQGSDYEFRPGNEGLIRNGSTLVLTSPVLTYQNDVWIPVQELCEMMNISLLDDPNQNNLFCTSIAGEWGWTEGIRIPILMYHGVTDNTWGAEELFVSPSDMEAQIKYLVENGYDTITFEDWSHLEDFDKPVMLTFDDGYLDNYEELFPILQKYNAKATIFVITTSVDKDARTMTSIQAKEMTDSGLVSIQSHTFNHPHLSECDGQELENQMLWSKIAIARMTGYEPFVLCYPYGDSDEQAREAAMKYYKFGLNMTGGLYTTSSDVFQIPRYYVARSTSLSTFIDMVEDAGT